MKTRSTAILLATGVAIAAPVLALAGTPAPQGAWLWDDGSVGVEFHGCGTSLCARVIWLKHESEAGAGRALDVKNPDPALRSRPLCGVDYITGVKRTPGGDWKGGKVYDFNSGATYDLDIDSVEPQRVRMRGYKGNRLLGANLTLVAPAAQIARCAAAGSR